jgi:MFS family permease
LRTALDWITIATVVVGTVSSALMPALGAVLGDRRLMVISMGCLAAGSLASALAPDVAVLLPSQGNGGPGRSQGPFDRTMTLNFTFSRAGRRR